MLNREAYRAESIPSASQILGLDSLGENALDLRPDPKHFVAFVKSIDRKDIAGTLFVRALDQYAMSRNAGDAVDPMQYVLCAYLYSCQNER